jgi:hypothetical protein
MPIFAWTSIPINVGGLQSFGAFRIILDFRPELIVETPRATGREAGATITWPTQRILMSIFAWTSIPTNVEGLQSFGAFRTILYFLTETRRPYAIGHGTRRGSDNTLA